MSDALTYSQEWLAPVDENSHSNRFLEISSILKSEKTLYVLIVDLH